MSFFLERKFRILLSIILSIIIFLNFSSPSQSNAIEDSPYNRIVVPALQWLCQELNFCDSNDPPPNPASVSWGDGTCPYSLTYSAPFNGTSVTNKVSEYQFLPNDPTCTEAWGPSALLNVTLLSNGSSSSFCVANEPFIDEERCDLLPSPPDICSTEPYASGCVDFCFQNPAAESCQNNPPPIPPASCLDSPYLSQCQDFCTQYPGFCEEIPEQEIPEPPTTCDTNPYSSECLDFCSEYPIICSEPPGPPDICDTNPYSNQCQSYCSVFPCPDIPQPPDPPDICTTNPYSNECQNYCFIYPSACPTPPQQSDDDDNNDNENLDPPVQCGLSPLPPCEIEILDPDDLDLPDILQPEFPEFPDSNNQPCSDCQSDFTNQNFFQYALTQFSQKFPFDVIGDYSILPDEQECPSLTIYSKQWDFCVIPNSTRLLKYPIWFLFLIRLILH